LRRRASQNVVEVTLVAFLCLVIIDRAGTNSHAKREATTKRGSTPERWRRVDAERGFRSAGDVKTRGPGCGRKLCYAASRHS